MFAMTAAFSNVFLAAYFDGGGTLPPDKKSEEWFVKREAQERQFIEALIVALALLVTKPTFDIGAWAQARADGYVATLDGIINVAKMRAVAATKPETLYEFQLVGPDSKESCGTCIDLLGRQKTARWIIDHNLIPTPGNDQFECLAFRCPHAWVSASGQELE